MPILSTYQARQGFVSIPQIDILDYSIEEQQWDFKWIEKYYKSPYPVPVLPTLINILTDFVTILAAAKTKTLSQLSDEVRLKGQQLFAEGARLAQSYFDDRPLYFARLNAQRDLKAEARKWKSNLIKTSDNQMLLPEYKNIRDRLEFSSRNLNNIDFSSAIGKMKFIVTGFDPYLEAGDSNASGNIALRLHGETISNSAGSEALIQSCIVPTRWQDFDDGIIENHLAEFINEPNKRVNMILSLSLDDAMDQKIAVVERFATVARTTEPGATDNNGVPQTKPSCLDLSQFTPATGQGNPTWTQSTLPSDLIDNSSSFASIFKIHLRESYSFIRDKQKFGMLGMITCLPHLVDFWGNGRTLSAANISPFAKYVDYRELIFVDHVRELRRTDFLTKGSGGNFLSNEIFYRIALIRERHQSTIDEDTPNMSTGHIHVPAITPNEETGATNHIDAMTILLRERLKVCIVPTGYFQNKLLP
jgi:pyrrolidone-carboxylate peptidase